MCPAAGIKIEKECLVCGRIFTVTPSRGNKKWCSSKCLGESRKDRVEKICESCGEVFIIPKSHNGRTYCSRLCVNEAEKIENKNPTSRVNIRNWFVRRGLLKQCNRCGFSNVKALEVHHIDYDSQNNDVNNLEVICANCHSIEHAP